MMRASEPPTNERRLSYGLVQGGIFITLLPCVGRNYLSRMGLKVPRGADLVKKAGEKKTVKPLASSQIRAARALLRWTVVDLAREAALGRNTILRAEVADDQTSLTVANNLAVRRALEG